MLDLRHAGARSEELSRGGAVRRFLGGALEVERESFVVGGLATLLRLRLELPDALEPRVIFLCAEARVRV